MRLLSLAFEILPLAVFFIVNASRGLIAAAVASTVAAGVVLGAAWIRERRIAAFPVFSVAISAIFAAAAVIWAEETFVKVQPTVFNGVFAAVLLGGLAAGIPAMRLFFGRQFDLRDETWRTLTLRWGLFLAVVALANEAARHLLSDDGWVVVKVFVIPGATGLFALAQLPVTLRGRVRPTPERAVIKM